MKNRVSTRTRLIEKARGALERKGIHWHMLLVVVGTVGVGMLSSTMLLTFGLRIIWLRYVLAAVIAYVGFLGLVRLWIRLVGADGSESSEGDAQPTSIAEEVVIDNAFDFAQGVVHGFAEGTDQAQAAATGGGDSGGSLFELPDLDLDVDGDSAAPLVLLIILAVVALGGLIAAGFLIYSAPVFFAEVFVDAAIGYGLYRRLRPAGGQPWLQTAIARTWLPFLVVAVLLGLAGEAIHEFMPGAVSIGDVFRGK